jgi:protocatechuate 3,4-dioxygenase beta subunit
MPRPNPWLLLWLLVSVSVFGQGSTSDIADAPASLSNVARIAPSDEPGVPIVITGTVVASDGATPVAGIIVYGYHTDASGYYRRTNTGNDGGEDHPRLRGWARTDGSGRFSFLTIMPAPYPHRNVPAHVHIHVWGSGYPRQWFELEFQGDPLIASQHFTDNTADFLYIMPKVSHGGRAEEYSVTLRVRKTSNFPSR